MDCDGFVSLDELSMFPRLQFLCSGHVGVISDAVRASNQLELRVQWRRGLCSMSVRRDGGLEEEEVTKTVRREDNM